jgi:hypothetical protein
MATTPKAPTRAAFLRDLFQKNPKVSKEEANAAWQQAGNEGTISKNTLYNYRSEFKKQSAGGVDSGEAAGGKAKPKTSSKRNKAKKITKPVERPAAQADGRDAAPEPEVGSVPKVRSEPEVGSKPARTGDQGRVLDEVEDGIDDLIFRLKEIGGKTEVLEALRKARRILARSHES